MHPSVHLQGGTGLLVYSAWDVQLRCGWVGLKGLRRQFWRKVLPEEILIPRKLESYNLKQAFYGLHIFWVLQ